MAFPNPFASFVPFVDNPTPRTNPMRYLVTGGCGFIGSSLVDRLVELGHDVVALDDFSTSEGDRANPDATLVEASITDPDAVFDAAKGADCIFHTAAWARIPRSIEDPVGTHQVNVTGTLSVLQAARQNGVPRVIYSSSSSVYGDQPTHVMHEDMPLNPKSPYALQKLMGELYCSSFARLFGLRVASLRYFNVYGPRQATQGAYVLVIPHFMRLRDAGKPLTVYGDGEQTRGYTHVSDVVRANVLAATADLPEGENVALNIGPSEETSVNDIAAIVGGEVVHVIPNPRGDFEELRKSADYSKAKSLIGWEPLIPAVEGIRQIAATDKSPFPGVGEG